MTMRDEATDSFQVERTYRLFLIYPIPSNPPIMNDQVCCTQIVSLPFPFNRKCMISRLCFCLPSARNIKFLSIFFRPWTWFQTGIKLSLENLITHNPPSLTLQDEAQ